MEFARPLKAALRQRLPATIIKCTPYVPDIGTHLHTHARKHTHIAYSSVDTQVSISIVAQLSDSCAFNGNFPRINLPQKLLQKHAKEI